MSRSLLVRLAWRWSVAALVVAGAALRVWVLVGRLGTFDSDEAVVGLLARQLGDGHLRAFYWAQHYGGTLEPALVALAMAVAGTSAVVVKAVPAVLSGVAAALVWRLGSRVLPERSAQAAGLLCWVAPAGYVWWSTKERGFYWVGLCLGLALLLAVVHAGESPRRWWPWAAIGLAAGAGFWTTPTIAYFVVPGGVWLLAGRRVDWSRAWVAVPAAAVGALPWLDHNLGHGWPSLEKPPQPEHVGYLGGVGRFLWQVLPIALDLRVPVSGRWQVPVAGPALLVGLGAAVVVAAWRRPDRPVLVLVGLAAYPLLYAVFPVAWFVGEGRYGLFALPFLALTLAWLARRPPVLLGVCALALVLTVVGLGRMGSERPRSVTDDVRALRAAGVDHLWADYWVAYRVTFETDERIVATSYRAARHQPYVDATLADPTPAYAYARGDGQARRLSAVLGERGVPFRRLTTRHLDVVLVGRPVRPDQLPAGLAP